MSSCVHFKFKSAKAFETITFSGSFIKLIDLKRAVVEAKSLQKGMDFDLSVVDNHSKEEYTDDDTMVAKNTSVIVKRIPPMRGRPGLLSKIKTLIPVAGQQKTTTTPLQPAPAKQLEEGSGQALASGSSASDSSSTAGTMTQEQEANAIAALNVQAGVHRQGFSNKVWTAGGGAKASDVTARAPRPSGGPIRPTLRKHSGPPTLTAPAVSKGVQGSYGSGSGTSGNEPPPGYVCKRCNIPGHFIKECPTNGNVAFDTARRKRTLGVPATMLKVVENQAGGGLVDAQGRLVVIQSNKAAFTKLKDQKGGGGSRADTVELLSLSAPSHLKCPLCEKLVTDAVLVPCCQGSACDKCVRESLAANALKCPLCDRGGVSPDLLMANKSLRAAVDHLILTSTMDSEMKAALEREEAEAREEKARLDGEQAKVGAIETDKKKQPEVTRADAKLDLGPDATAVAESEADEFGGNVYAAATSTPTQEVSTSESPNHITEPSSSPIDAEVGGGSSAGVDTQGILHGEETEDHHQQSGDGSFSPTSEGRGIGGDSDANHAAMVGGWSGLRKEKEVKESIGSDFSGGGGVDPKHGANPSHPNMHSMGGPGPYPPPGMRRMGAMGPRPPPWVGRGIGPMGQWGGSPGPYMMMRGPGGFMPPWGMGPGPMPHPRGGGVWHRGGRRGGGRGSATRPPQQYTGDNTTSPSSGPAGSGGEEETTASIKTSGEKGSCSSPRLKSKRENDVKAGESSGSRVVENSNREEEETEGLSTVHESGWGGNTDENEVLQTGWGDAYVDSSVSQTGWVSSDELQVGNTTACMSGDDSTVQTGHSENSSQTGVDSIENKRRKREAKGNADFGGKGEAGNAGWPKSSEGINTSHEKFNADAHTYKDGDRNSRGSPRSKSQYGYSARKRYRGESSRRYGPSGGGSSYRVSESSQERKKRSRSSKDDDERYSSTRQPSSSFVNSDDRASPRSENDESREQSSRRKDDRIRRDHTVKRESDIADAHTYKDSHSRHVSRSSKTQHDYSERKRYRGESRRDGPSGGGSSCRVRESSQERKKRSRSSKDDDERYSSTRQPSSSCVNSDGRASPRSQNDESREQSSRRKDDRIRRDHTVKRESGSSSRSQVHHKRHNDLSNGNSKRDRCSQQPSGHHREAPEMKERSLSKNSRG